MKVCTKCKMQKPLSDFHNCASKPGGKFSACKQCRNAYNKAKAEEIGYSVLYKRALGKDPEAYKKRQADYYASNRELVKKRSREWNKINKDRKALSGRAHYEKNKESYIENAKAWSAKNKDKRLRVARAYASRFYSDPDNKPVLLSRKLLSRTLLLTGKRKKTKTESEIGYTVTQLKEHLEFHFQDGMSWENHGAWHVDHIIPVTEMVALGVTCPKKINALSNLRPVWASDNLSKNNRFDLSSPMVNV